MFWNLEYWAGDKVTIAETRRFKFERKMLTILKQDTFTNDFLLFFFSKFLFAEKGFFSYKSNFLLAFECKMTFVQNCINLQFAFWSEAKSESCYSLELWKKLTEKNFGNSQENVGRLDLLLQMLKRSWCSTETKLILSFFLVSKVLYLFC